MRRLVSLLWLAAGISAAGDLPYFNVLSEDAGAWPEILSSIGLQAGPAGVARIFVARSGAAASTEWRARVEKGDFLILEGESSLSEMFGFSPGRENVKVNSLTDVHEPRLALVWEHGLELPVYSLPEGARVFARERWTGAPMSAGLRIGSGAVLWIAVPPGERGFERFPYMLQAMCDLGFEPPFRTSRLWAFFDSAYRSRVDLDYFAARWRKAGIAALHVAAWHFYDPDLKQDKYLRRLIEACHREGILVYAWLELPHVSEAFWAAHPEWREKTALLQDAQLDWRKLMNLANRECSRAVAEGVAKLIGRFDWDGVNLAELYFESLEGVSNPSRFTPMNSDVRSEFRRAHGFDPIEIFGSHSDQGSRKGFLDFRSALARRIEEEWLTELESMRREKPYLDLVLTHVDDRSDTGIRDAIGADASQMLPLLNTHNFTFLIEDPATVWDQGAQRYAKIANQYRILTQHHEKLAIDLNIVGRYQDVYPTKQQTGIELFELVQQASKSFQRVALYFENSLLSADYPLLSASAAAVTRVETLEPKLVVDSVSGVGIPWRGPALVDGELWPVADAQTLWLPPGPHTVENTRSAQGPHIVQVNADLKAARILSAQKLELSYQASARAIVILDRTVERVEIDGLEAIPATAGPKTLLLPRGQHVVTLTTD
jgi:hypothetical protein